MRVGLNIAEGVKINIGDQYDTMQNTLERCGINYEVPYQQRNGALQKIIVYMRSEGIEVNVDAGVVTYIHASNAKLNTLFNVETGMTSADTLQFIRNKLAELFQSDQKDIRIDKFNSKNYSTVIQVNTDGLKIRIHLEANIANDLYISTLRLLKESVDER